MTTRQEPPRICPDCGRASVPSEGAACLNCWYLFANEEPLHRALPVGQPVYLPQDEGNAPD